MTDLRTRDIIALGFMTFALFIGAGKISSAIVAQQAGEHVWLAALGFLITAVGLPVITIMALSRVEGSTNFKKFAFGAKIAALILTVACYLAVGPLRRHVQQQYLMKLVFGLFWRFREYLIHYKRHLFCLGDVGFTVSTIFRHSGLCTFPA